MRSAVGADGRAAMGIVPLRDDELRVGKATRGGRRSDNAATHDVSPSFADNAPLWYYVLAEAQQQFKKDRRRSASDRSAGGSSPRSSPG